MILLTARSDTRPFERSAHFAAVSSEKYQFFVQNAGSPLRSAFLSTRYGVTTECIRPGGIQTPDKGD